MVSWLIQNDQARGDFNATAPEPVTNREFTHTLGRVLHRPAVLVAPAFALRAALGELASSLIEGQRVLPAHAERLGFRFLHRRLEPALESMNL
jgi:NAD dependent epimerase/dehydratase family enzyme